MNFLKRLFNIFKSVFTSDKAQKVAQTIADLLPKALPVVKAIAAMTPTRADDEIIAVCERYSVPVLAFYLTTPVEARGRVLLDIAARIVKRFTPDVVDNIIDSAVQLAVSGMKAEA